MVSCARFELVSWLVSKYIVLLFLSVMFVGLIFGLASLCYICCYVKECRLLQHQLHYRYEIL